MEIFENKIELLNDFIDLNHQWIAHYFEIEQVDRALFANPKQIIEQGGYVFSLVEDNQVVGVCALFNEKNGVYELARMAVSPNCQGKGYGKLLLEAVLAKLKTIKAKRVYLVSNTKLKAAIHLYRQYGFTTISEGPHPIYTRAKIIMSQDIT